MTTENKMELLRIATDISRDKQEDVCETYNKLKALLEN